MAQAHQTEKQATNGRRSPAEWTTLIVTFLMVGALAAALAWHAFTAGDQASFAVNVDDAAIAQHGDAYHVPFAVQNTGSMTVEDVLVKVALLDGDQTIDEAEVTFRFLGDGETARGVAVFADDPHAYTIEAHVTSYLEP